MNEEKTDVQMSCSDLISAINRMTKQITYDFEVMTNKAVNRTFERYSNILNTYYDRINQISLDTSEARGNAVRALNEVYRSAEQLQEINENIKSSVDTVKEAMKQNSAILSLLADLIDCKENGFENIDKTIDKANQINQTLLTECHFEQPEKQSDEEKPVDNENDVKAAADGNEDIWQKYNLKNPVDIFNDCSMNHSMLQYNGFEACEILPYDGGYQIKKSKSFVFWRIVKGNYALVFPGIMVKTLDNKDYFEEFFNISYENLNALSAKIAVEHAAMAKKNPETGLYDFIATGILSIV